VADTLIVKLSGLDPNGVPTSAREIAGRVNQITFMQPMLRDVEVIEAVRRHSGRWLRSRDPADARLGRHRFHLIEAGRFTSALAPESKGKPDIELLTYLFDAGRSEIEKWLARHRCSIGTKATVDLGAHFLKRTKPTGSDPSHPSAAMSNAASKRGVT
jgi:NTE family protein